MSGIAGEAGISKALLYHYFPSKQAFFQATLAEAAEELAEQRARAHRSRRSCSSRQELDAYLAWIEEHAESYRKLIERGERARGARAGRRIRAQTARRILHGLGGGAAPGAGRGVRLALVHGRRLPQLDREPRHLSRDELRGLLLGTLLGAITASGHQDVLTRLAPAP